MATIDRVAELLGKEPRAAKFITGRKAFQRPMEEGIKPLNLVQDIYLEPQVKLA